MTHWLFQIKQVKLSWIYYTERDTIWVHVQCYKRITGDQSFLLFSFYVFGQEHERVTIFLDIPMSLTIISMSYLTCDLQLKVTSVMRLLTCWTNFLQLTTIHGLSWENHRKTSFSPPHGEKVMLHFVWPLRRRNKDSWVHWQVKNLATIPVWSWILFTERSLLTRLLK